MKLSRGFSLRVPHALPARAPQREVYSVYNVAPVPLAKPLAKAVNVEIVLGAKALLKVECVDHVLQDR